MARNVGLDIQNKFIKGLITQTTSLNFPVDACTETFNCVFDYTGVVSRRLGVDLESGFVLNNITAFTNEAHSVYLWNSIDNYPTGAYLVCQQGPLLHFFDVSNNMTPSAHKESITISLNDFFLTNGAGAPTEYRCSFAQGAGYLIVINRYTAPIYIKYSPTGTKLTAIPFTVRERDFVGMDDGLTLMTRPPGNPTQLIASNPKHYYNLRNQGWYTDALGDWDASSSLMPSNADAPGYFRVSSENLVSTNSIKANNPYATPAPKGHFIYEVGGFDPAAGLAEDSILVNPGAPSLAEDTAGVPFGDATANLANAFDGLTGQNAANSASKTGTDMYIGVSFSPSLRRIGHINLYGSTDQGFVLAGEPRFELYAKNGAPANSTDGTRLFVTETTTGGIFGNYTASLRNVDPAQAFTHWWVRITDTNNANTTFYIAEMDVFDTPGTSTEGPTAVAFFGGRAWFAGFNKASIGTKIYFSQIVDNPDKFGRCYQLNDPTSDKFADLLATDGGVINVPELGNVQALFPFQGQLLVMTNNGIWIVSGGGQGIFSATDYRVRRISSIGMSSPKSVVDVKGLPIWWGDDGIYTVTYDANYDSTVVTSLTEETIKDFITAIPSFNRQYVQGTYDKYQDTVYWFYNDSGSFGTSNFYDHTKVLCLNIKSGAFYPWTLNTSAVTPQKIRYAQFIQDGERKLTPGIRLGTTYTKAGTYRLTFSDVTDTSYTDWVTYAADTGQADTKDYSSYFISGYRLDGKAMTTVSSPYVLTYCENFANSSVFMQGIFDWTNTNASSKWSTPQQAYRDNYYHDTKVSRLMVRGSGKAIQCKYYSQTGKPFFVIGWGIMLSGNTEL